MAELTREEIAEEIAGMTRDEIGERLWRGADLPEGMPLASGFHVDGATAIIELEDGRTARCTWEVTGP